MKRRRTVLRQIQKVARKTQQQLDAVQQDALKHQQILQDIRLDIAKAEALLVAIGDDIRRFGPQPRSLAQCDTVAKHLAHLRDIERTCSAPLADEIAKVGQRARRNLAALSATHAAAAVIPSFPSH